MNLAYIYSAKVHCGWVIRLVIADMLSVSAFKYVKAVPIANQLSSKSFL